MANGTDRNRLVTQQITYAFRVCYTNSVATALEIIMVLTDFWQESEKVTTDGVSNETSIHQKTGKNEIITANSNWLELQPDQA